jgi:hypothetical protein
LLGLLPLQVQLPAVADRLSEDQHGGKQHHVRHAVIEDLAERFVLDQGPEQERCAREPGRYRQ